MPRAAACGGSAMKRARVSGASPSADAKPSAEASPQETLTPEGLRVAAPERYCIPYEGLTAAVLQERLLVDGVVVVTGVVPAAVAADALEGFMQDAKALVERRAVGSDHPVPPWEVQPKGNGGCSLWKGRGCALTTNAQRRRLNTRARQVYSLLYGVPPEQLVIACDAFALRLAAWDGRNAYPKAPQPHDPIKEVTRRTLGSTLRLHQDATIDGPGGGRQAGSMVHGLAAGGFFPHCVQGAIVYREERTTRTADGRHTLVYPGFVACPGPPEPLHAGGGGHRRAGDWYVLPQAQLSGGDHGEVLERLRYIPAPAGSLRLWRSDIIHGNTHLHRALLQLDNLQPWDITRAAQFVCWGPRCLLTPEDAQKRLEWAQKGGSHNHWPTIHSQGCRGGHMSDDGSWLRTLPEEAIRLLPEQVRALGVPPEARQPERGIAQERDGRSKKARQ